jgi:hypothetical protein
MLENLQNIIMKSEKSGFEIFFIIIIAAYLSVWK